MGETEKILEARKGTHGEYMDNAWMMQRLRELFRQGRNWPTLPDIVKESFDSWAIKLGRILSGNPYVHEHYMDISGYALLIPQRTIDGVGLKPEYAALAGPDPMVAAQKRVEAMIDVYTGGGVEQLKGIVDETAIMQNERLVPRYAAGNSDPVAYERRPAAAGDYLVPLDTYQAMPAEQAWWYWREGDEAVLREWASIDEYDMKWPGTQWRPAGYLRVSDFWVYDRSMVPAGRLSRMSRYPREANTKELQEMPVWVRPMYAWINSGQKYKMLDSYINNWGR